MHIKILWELVKVHILNVCVFTLNLPFFFLNQHAHQQMFWRWAFATPSAFADMRSTGFNLVNIGRIMK